MKKNEFLTAKPETFSQAQTWDLVKQRYIREGLCETDAAQAAWGHQNGFTQINDPCEECRGITLSLELIEKHGTRARRWLDGEWIKPKEH